MKTNTDKNVTKNLTKKVLLASSIAMAMSQVSAAPTARIIGGSQATAGSYPWVVSLKGSGGDHFCGASLIDKEWVLTAAHCVEGETASGMSVVVGEFNTVMTDAGEQKRNVTKITMHPQYNKGVESNNDIALLKLASPVSNKAVTQVVPNIMKDIKDGSLLTVMGWGNQSTTGEEFPNRLFQVEVPLVSNQECSSNYEASGIEITDKMICAGFKQGGKDSCQGDSGGPLLYQLNGTWQQVGIVSFGEGCALPGKPGVYARVEKYNDWVSQQIGTTTTNPTPVDPVTPNPEPVDPVAPEPTTPEEPETETEVVDAASFNLPDEIELIARDSRPEESVLKLENTTSQNIDIVDISVNQSVFSIVKNDCVTILKSGKSCELTLKYQPEVGDFEAEGDLIIDLADGTNITVAVYGSNLVAVDETDNDNQETDENNGSDNEFAGDGYDFDDIDWYLDSDAWSEENDGYYMDSTNLDLNDFATMSAEIDGEGAFEFDFDFENDYDENYCSYYVDGKLVRTLRGANKSTTHHVTQLSKGKHEIMWVYKKKSENSGTLKIKNIKFSKANTSSTTIPAPAQTNPTPTPVSVEPATTVPTNSLASTETTSSSNNRSGGGSTDILLLSGLLMLLGRAHKFFS